jgi:hypothetical protein
MIDMLPKERWHELEEIFKVEFDAILPHQSSQIIADVDDETGEIKGFLVTELLIRVGQIHKPGNSGRAMFQWMLERMPRDVAVIAIASSERFESLCEAFQMRPVEGKVFRRDFN